ncbi:MAG TPA: FAD-dependent monooxygenase [Burkholderiales bacterium]|nr:FAD-dependent monooxygenase [Burkholderiales bacterium]
MAAAPLDILISGGGPVGCTLALALRDSPHRVALVERAPAPERARALSLRPIALSYASRLILERVGVWPMLSPTPIETIHVSQAGGFGRVRMDAAEARVPALGYVVEYGALSAALSDRIGASGIEVLNGAAHSAARCVAHAEGHAEDANEKRYDQDAVVGLLETSPAAGNTAFERFTSEGPLALLPLAGRYAFVWGARPERARALAQAPEREFLQELAHTIGARAGRPVSVEGRAVHPLALRVRASRIGAREVFVGNAAQTLHPVAGQGLNLGLRDAWQLAVIWRDAEDPGAPAVLERFAARRRLDVGATIRLTDLLASVFLGANPILGAARGLALSALDVLPPARRFFARRMIYGSSAIP